MSLDPIIIDVVDETNTYLVDVVTSVGSINIDVQVPSGPEIVEIDAGEDTIAVDVVQETEYSVDVIADFGPIAVDVQVEGGPKVIDVIDIGGIPGPPGPPGSQGEGITQEDADLLYLKLIGGSLSGGLTIDSDTNAGLDLTGAGWPAVVWNTTSANGTAAGYFESQRQGRSRWSVEFGGTQLESTGNQGTNFLINRFDDAGHVLYPSPIAINRATGEVTFGSIVTLAIDPTGPMQAATRQYVDTFSGVGKFLALTGGTLNPGPLAIENDSDNPRLTLTGLSGIGSYQPIFTLNTQAATGGIGLIQSQRNGALRWSVAMGDGLTLEDGSGIGTDFILSRFDDGGGLLGNVLTFNRKTGAAQISGDLNVLGPVILSAGDPTTALQAATMQYVLSKVGNFLPISGGNLLGPLSINWTGFNWTPGPLDQNMLTLTANTLGPGSFNGIFIIMSGSGAPAFTGAASQGSISSPVPPLFTQTLVKMGGRGFDGAGWSHDQASVMLKTNELWNTTSHGTFILFEATPKGTLTNNSWMVFNGSGNLLIGTNDPASDDLTHRLQVRGSATFTGSVDLQYYPTSAAQAASKEYVDDQVQVVHGAYLPLVGGQLSGGLSFGQATAPNQNPSDFSRHISLYDGFAGFSITNGRINVAYSTGSLYFVSNLGDVAYFYGSGLWLNTNYTVTLGRDPSTALEAATMQYVQSQVASGAFLPLVGGTVTGPIIVKATRVQLQNGPFPGSGVNSFSWWDTINNLGAGIRPGSGSTGGGELVLGPANINGGVSDNTWMHFRAGTNGAQFWCNVSFVDPSTTLTLSSDPTATMHAVTRRYVDNSITAAPYVKRSGDTMTGPLHINASAAGNPTLFLANYTDGANTNWPAIVFDRQSTYPMSGYFESDVDGKPRWSINFGDPAPETGGDAGTNFSINRFNDAGHVLSPQPFAINRQLGIVTIATPLMLGGPPSTGNQAATMQYVLDTIAGGAFLPLAGGIMQGGIVFADVWGQGPADVSHHLTLHSGFGIGVSATTRMNYVAGATGQHVFMAGVDIAWIQSGGLWMASGNAVHLAQDPTAGDQAVTKQYADRMLPLAGGNMTGGITFQSDVAHLGAGAADLSHHIALWTQGNVYGFSITSGRLNIVTGAQTWFSNSATGQDIAYFDTTNLNFVGLRTVILGRDPSGPMDAVTKQYADNIITSQGGPFLPISAGVGNALTGMLYLPHVTPTIDEQATPFFYVKAQDDYLQSQISAVVSGNLVFYGQLSVPNDTLHYKATLGLPDGPLPPPTAFPKGAYVIVTTGGVPPTGTGTNIPALPPGTPQYVRGDWFITDGTIWVFLPTGLVYFTADAVTVSPPIQGTSNVQATLQWLSDNKLNLAGGTMQGALYLANQPTTGMAAATQSYVDTKTGNYLPLAGGQMQGGISFGPVSVTSPTDTSKHITLWEPSPGAGGYGFGITGFRLNYNTDVPQASHVFMTGGIDVVAINQSGLTMRSGSLLLAHDPPTTGTEAATKNYVDGRTPLAVDAPNDTWFYGRHSATWSQVPGLQFIGAGAYDLNAVGPGAYIGLLNITNQTNAPNWPSDLFAQTALVLHGYNSNYGWQNQLLMGPAQNTNDPAIWYRNQSGGTWSPWWRMMTAAGGTFTGTVTFGAPVNMWTGGTLGAVPLTIQANGNFQVPAPIWGGAFSFNLSGGGSELDFLNLYTGAPRSFSWWQVDSATAMRQLGWFSPNGDFSVSGQVFLLGGTPTSSNMAASVGMVQAIDPTGKYLLLTGGTLTGDLFVPAIYMGSPLYIGNATSNGGQLVFNGPLSSFRSITWASGGHTIWDLQTEGAEPGDGTNAGGDFYFVSFDDTGNPLYNALVLSRSTGYVTVRGDPVSPLGVATMQYVDAVRTFAAGNYLPLSGGTVHGLLMVTGTANLEVSAPDWPRLTMTSPLRRWSVGVISGTGYFGIGDESIPTFRLTIDLNGGVTIPGTLTLGTIPPTFDAQAANKKYVDDVRTLVTGGYLPIGGGVMQGGLSFATGLLVTGDQFDVTRHVMFYDGGATNRFGFNVSFDGVKAHLNYVVLTNADHVFSVNRQFIAWIDGNGLTMGVGYLSLANDPTSNMHAVTLQYLNQRLAAGVTSFNSRTGAVTLTSGDVTSALTYTPVNRAGDTMTGELVVTVLPTSTSAQLQIGPPWGVGNNLEGKLRFTGTFGTGVPDLGPRFITSLRSGMLGGWGSEYLDVWINNGGINDANSDDNQVQVVRFTRGGLSLPAGMVINLAQDPTSALQVATAQYADGVIARNGGPFLPLSGGQVTGLLEANGWFLASSNSASIQGVTWGTIITNNLNAGQGETDFVNCWQNYGGFSFWQMQAGFVRAPVFYISPTGNVGIYGTGIIYSVPHGGNTIAFSWYNNNIDSYVDGNRIGAIATWEGANSTFLPIAGGTALGMIHFNAGLSFLGGDFSPGSIYTDSNWGALIRGRAGAIADVALADRDGHITFQMFNGGAVAFTAGATFYGPDPIIRVDGPAESWRTIQYSTSGAVRWNVQASADPENGNNAGSNYFITRFLDNGAAEAVLAINRQTARVTIQPSNTSDPMEIMVSSGQNARYRSTVQGVRTWSFGTRSDGSFLLGDETAQRSVLTLDTGGNAIFGYSVYVSGAGHLSLGNKLAPGGNPQDTSNHITMWEPGYGFSITGNTLNLCSGGSTLDFYNTSGRVISIVGTGVWFSSGVQVTLGRDPVGAMEAATRGYVDNNFGAAGLHPSWLHVSGSTTSYVPQGGYMMWNRSGGGMTNLVNNRGLGGGGFTFTDTDGTTDVELFRATTARFTSWVGATVNAYAGQWTPFNIGQQLLIQGTQNNSIGIASSSGDRYVAMINSGGAMQFASMPQPNDTTTPPTTFLTLTTTGATFNVGPTTLAADPSANMHAVTKQWVVAGYAPLVNGPYVAKTGDTMSGALEVGAAGNGRVELSSGGASNTGYIAWFNPAGARQGYLGFASGTTMDFHLENQTNRLDLWASLHVTAQADFDTSITVGINATVTGLLTVKANGVQYTKYASNQIGFGWDGTFLVGHVDGTNTPGQLAGVSWVQANYYSTATSDARYFYKAGDTCSGIAHFSNQIWADGNVIFFGGSSTIYMNWDGTYMNLRAPNIAIAGPTTVNGLLTLPQGLVVSGGHTVARGNNTSPGWGAWNTASGGAAMAWWVTGAGGWQFGSCDGNGVPGTIYGYLSQSAFGANTATATTAVNNGANSAWWGNSTDFNVPGQGWKPSGGVWSTGSDARMKDVLGEYEQGLDAILKLRPIRYRYKDNWRHSRKHDVVDDFLQGRPALEQTRRPNMMVAKMGTVFVGLIAQEVEGVMPEMVGRIEGELDDVEVDDIRTMDASALPYAIVNAIKELVAMNEALTARVATLEARTQH